MTTWRIALGMVLLLLMALLLAATPTPFIEAAPSAVTDCDEDLTGETIPIYHFGDFSGPYSLITVPALRGFEDAISYLNAEQNGICGATIESVYRDTGADPNAVLAAWNDFATREDAYAILLYMTEDAEMLRQQATDAQMPLMVTTGSVSSLYGDDANTPAYTFAITPLYEDQLGEFCEYISQTWDDLGIEGDPVIGHVSWLGVFGESSDSPEARAYCQSLGVGYAGAQYFFPGIPDISTQVQRVMDEGATIIYTTTVGSGPSQVAQTLATMDITAGEDVLLAGPNWVLDYSALLVAGPTANTMIGQFPYYWWDEGDHPGIQQVTRYILENYDTNNPEVFFQLRSVAYLLTWAAADLYRDIIIDTINRVGYQNLSSQAAYESLVSGQTYTGLDGVLTMRYDEFLRAPNQTRFGQVQFVDTENGTITQMATLTDWREMPDLRPGGADVPVDFESDD